MVYWGCSTTRNKCVWTACAAFAAAAAVLLCVGAGQMWVCDHRATPAGGTQQQTLNNCRVKAGITMALCPVVVILGLLPCLLFFQSCMAVPPPQPVDWEKGVPASGITVVRRTCNGAAVYRYDSSGKLLQAPDCYRHSGSCTPPSPAKLHTGPFPWQPTELDVPQQQYNTAAATGMSPLSQASHSPYSSPGKQYTGGPLNSSNSNNAGGNSTVVQQGSADRGQQYSPHGQYSPRVQQYSPRSSRQYDSNLGLGSTEGGTAEVYISLSPLKEGARKK